MTVQHALVHVYDKGGQKISVGRAKGYWRGATFYSLRIHVRFSTHRKGEVQRVVVVPPVHPEAEHLSKQDWDEMLDTHGAVIDPPVRVTEDNFSLCWNDDGAMAQIGDLYEEEGDEWKS